MQDGGRDLAASATEVTKRLDAGKDDAESLHYKCQPKPAPASVMPRIALAYWKALSHTIKTTTVCQQGEKKGLTDSRMRGIKRCLCTKVAKLFPVHPL